MRRKKKTALSTIQVSIGMLLAWSLLFTGCGSIAEDQEGLVVIDTSKEESQYSLQTVEIDDVVKTQQIKCVYKQVNDQDISFSMSGKEITSVYVKEGDLVKEGQLLAELSSGQRANEIAALEYQINRNKLLMEYADVNENYEISGKWVWYLYQSMGSNADEETLNKAIESIKQNYSYIREDCQDTIELSTTQLEALKSEEDSSRVYARMDGVISYLKEDLQGRTSLKGETIMTVIDNSECFFESEDLEYIDSFKEDTRLTLSITSGTGAGTYVLVPFKPEAWKDSMSFAIEDTEAAGNIGVGASGSAKFELQRAKGVLTIPTQAVHMADGKPYVYVVGDNDTKEVKWIETGLYGDTKVEVISGLSEGEKVILK